MKIKPFVGWWIDCHLLALFWSVGQITGLHSKHIPCLIIYAWMYEWVERNMLTRGCVKIFFTLVHWTNTDKLKKRKKNDLRVFTIIYIPGRLFTLRYNNNTQSHTLCTNWNGFVSHSLPKKRGENCMILVNCAISQKLQLHKMVKKSMGFWGPLTSSCLVRGLNHRKRAEPRAGRSCASRSKEIATILVITWVFVFPWMCSFRT